jgi:regulatory protein
MGGVASRKPALSLKGQALQWLARREHSRTEMRRKLLAQGRALSVLTAATGAEPEDAPVDLQTRVEAVLDWLDLHRYLCEERFVESRVHARAARYGNLRIRQELAQHGLDLPADAALALKTTELDRARAVWQRKFTAGPKSAAERGRQQRFLAGRGFSAEVIHQLLRVSNRAAEDAADTAESES